MKWQCLCNFFSIQRNVAPKLKCLYNADVKFQQPKYTTALRKIKRLYHSSIATLNSVLHLQMAFSKHGIYLRRSLTLYQARVVQRNFFRVKTITFLMSISKNAF